jgi:hypothetical protein
MSAPLSWEYISEELAIFWDSPYGHGKEKIASFWWPAHPVEATAEVEARFEVIAQSLIESSCIRDLLTEVFRLLPGWREAIAELEDFCGESVRLKNMIAALDQIDDLYPRIKNALVKSRANP